METLDEAKNYIRFLYTQVLEKKSREEMLMKEISSKETEDTRIKNSRIHHPHSTTRGHLHDCL